MLSGTKGKDIAGTEWEKNKTKIKSDINMHT